MKAVKYEGDFKELVDEFNARPKNEMKGDYWNNTHNDKTLESLKAYIKQHYLEAQNFTCAYCRQKYLVKHHAVWDTEHIIDKKNYPQFTFKEENLCISCKDCNGQNAKGNKNVLVNPNRVRFPKNKENYIFVHPHFDVYERHITHLTELNFYIPKTDKGKNTIVICDLLRFTYMYSNYEGSSIELNKRIIQLANKLDDIEDPYVGDIILDEMNRLIELRKMNRARGILADLGL